MNKNIRSLEHKILQSDKDHFELYFQCSIQIYNQHSINKLTKQLKGKIIFSPKISLLNIPIQLSIIGQSQCTLIQSEDLNIDHIKSNLSNFEPNSFRIHQTEQSLAHQKLNIERNFQSADYIEQKQKHKQPTNINKKQIFLEGKQTLIQKDKNKEEKIKSLKQNKIYQYQFVFFLPQNLPLSLNQRILPDLHLEVNYKLVLDIKIHQKFVLSNTSIKKSYFPLQTIKQKSFYIKPQTSINSSPNVTNRLILKYFHEKGLRRQYSCLSNCCCLNFLLQRIINTSYSKYDIYHCQIISHFNSPNILHVMGRIFMEPLKQSLDERRQKKGLIYLPKRMKNDKNDKNIQQKNNNRHQMTISKIIQEDQNFVQIKYLSVKLFTEVSNVKKTIIQQEILSLHQTTCDIKEGQIVVYLPLKFIPQKNQLFQIRYWLQVRPLSQQEVNQSDNSFVNKSDVDKSIFNLNAKKQPKILNVSQFSEFQNDQVSKKSQKSQKSTQKPNLIKRNIIKSTANKLKYQKLKQQVHFLKL